MEVITKTVEIGKGNLLELAVDAAQKRASLGEISDAVEKITGRYKAVIRSISGVYSQATNNSESFRTASAMADEFAERFGRRPRIMVAKMGQDGHDRGQKVVATGYADLGFDVNVGALFQTLEEGSLFSENSNLDTHKVGSK